MKSLKTKLLELVNNFNNKKNDKGFTITEVILAVFLVSIIMLVLFTIITEINEVDKKSKEMNFVEQLIEPYISYYKNIEVDTSNLNVLLSDLGEVNLVKEARARNISSVPNSFRNLNLICSNNPEVIKNAEGKDEYIKFIITCEKDRKKINNGKSFIIVKYINR